MFTAVAFVYKQFPVPPNFSLPVSFLPIRLVFAKKYIKIQKQNKQTKAKERREEFEIVTVFILFSFHSFPKDNTFMQIGLSEVAMKVRADETLPLLIKIVVSAAGVGTKLHCT